MPQPYNLFTIYAREDARLLSELLSHLKPLENNGRIKVWSDREINPGVRWEEEIVGHLDAADIILILVSPAYYNSEYIHRVEIKRAVERHQRGEATVLPIIVRPCAFEDDLLVSSLQVLPTDGKAVTDDEHWRSQDKAWLDVINGIKRTLNNLRDEENRREQTALAAEAQRAQEARDAENRRERERLAAERKKEKEERKPAAPLPWGRYAAISSGALALLLIMWLMFGGEKEQAAKIQSNQQDTVPLMSKFKDPFEKQMVRVMGGTFIMGNSESETRGDDECPHEVTVKSFSIGKYEVTQAQWKAIMGNNPSYNENCDDCPVEQVSWNDSQEFIKKLNVVTGKKYRLPTEAEWEFAAKGGNKSQGYKYAGSNNLGSVAWYNANSNLKTHPIGGKLPNELELYDMSGNVCEWCQDAWKPYPSCKTSYECSDCRPLRGCGWYSVVEGCLIARRYRNNPSIRGLDYGPSCYGLRLAHD